MHKPISACIAAYNEEKTIPYTLDSILGQSFPGEMEILVCANGCDDRTEAVVEMYERNFPNIRLISTREKGKPNAWNILREEASHNYVFFVDADVIVGRDAFSHIYQSLEETDNIGVGAICIPLFEGCGLLTRMTAPPPAPPGCLHGRLYAFDNQKLDERMHACSYPEMPKGIIHEDAWISLVIGDGNWTIAENAEVYYRPCSWKELPRIEGRTARAEAQIRKDYPELAGMLPNEKGFIEKSMSRLHKLRYCKGIKGKVLFSLGFFLRKYLCLKARRNLAYENFENPLDGWETSEHSKDLSACSAPKQLNF